jgi:RNA polymerase sigma-70 factor, ECF subfamily
MILANELSVKRNEMNDPESEELQRLREDRNVDQLANFIERNRSALSGFVRSIASARLLSVVELDDLIQEITATALKGLSTAPLDHYSPMQWLQQIARRRVIDAYRYHFGAQSRDAGRQLSINQPSQVDSSSPGMEQLLVASMTSASAAMSRDIRVNRMQAVIDQLPEDQRQVVLMRFVSGMPTKEIAAQLGKTDVAIRVLLSRTMRQLETQLSDVKPSR